MVKETRTFKFEQTNGCNCEKWFWKEKYTELKLGILFNDETNLKKKFPYAYLHMVNFTLVRMPLVIGCWHHLCIKYDYHWLTHIFVLQMLYLFF